MAGVVGDEGAFRQGGPAGGGGGPREAQGGVRRPRRGTGGEQRGDQARGREDQEAGGDARRDETKRRRKRRRVGFGEPRRRAAVPFRRPGTATRVVESRRRAARGGRGGGGDEREFREVGERRGARETRASPVPRDPARRFREGEEGRRRPSARRVREGVHQETVLPGAETRVGGGGGATRLGYRRALRAVRPPPGGEREGPAAADVVVLRRGRRRVSRRLGRDEHAPRRQRRERRERRERRLRRRRVSGRLRRLRGFRGDLLGDLLARGAVRDPRGRETRGECARNAKRRRFRGGGGVARVRRAARVRGERGGAGTPRRRRALARGGGGGARGGATSARAARDPRVRGFVRRKRLQSRRRGSPTPRFFLRRPRPVAAEGADPAGVRARGFRGLRAVRRGETERVRGLPPRAERRRAFARAGASVPSRAGANPAAARGRFRRRRRGSR